MEKKMLTQEMLNSGMKFESAGFKYVKPNMQGIEAAAEELASKTIYLQDNGTCCKSHRYTVIEAFVFAKYMTDIDTAEWEAKDDGVYDIANFILSESPCLEDSVHDLYAYSALMQMRAIWKDIFDMLKANHEREHSPAFILMNAFSDILGDGHIVRNLAHDKEVTEKLIDYLGLLKDAKESTPQTFANGQSILNFSKKK